MRRRVVKDALPPLTSFLDKQAPVSLKAGPVYQQSQAFKLQLAILRSLGRLCCQLEISEADLCHIVLICTQYLSSRQPRDLQKVWVVFDPFTPDSKTINDSDSDTPDSAYSKIDKISKITNQGKLKTKQ